jgi:hypothetical protein
MPTAASAEKAVMKMARVGDWPWAMATLVTTAAPRAAIVSWVNRSEVLFLLYMDDYKGCKSYTPHAITPFWMGGRNPETLTSTVRFDQLSLQNWVLAT